MAAGSEGTGESGAGTADTVALVRPAYAQAPDDGLSAAGQFLAGPIWDKNAVLVD